MNKKQEQEIVDYYSTTDKYIRSNHYSDGNQTVFTKELDRHQWLVLEQKNQCEVEIRQTDWHGKITAWDNYRLTKEFLDSYKRISRTDIDSTYPLPKSYVSYRKPRKPNDEQRERARQMMIAKNKKKERKEELLEVCVYL